MPPSGYDKKTVKGASNFARGCLEDLLEEVRSGKHKSFEEGIKFEIAQIKKALIKKPPSEFSQKAVKGALIFNKGCYEDLLKEVRSGKHKSSEEAINFEIAQIEKALTELHIDAGGNLVKR